MSVTPTAGSSALWNAGTGKSGSSPFTGGLSIGGAVAAAALVGATAAALSGHDGRRLASSFSRWARDTDRARAAAAAAAADKALAGARREAERERKAWESVQAALEGSAAAREREARESAQEEGREVRDVGALVLFLLLPSGGPVHRYRYRCGTFFCSDDAYRRWTQERERGRGGLLVVRGYFSALVVLHKRRRRAKPLDAPVSCCEVLCETSVPPAAPPSLTGRHSLLLNPRAMPRFIRC